MALNGPQVHIWCWMSMFGSQLVTNGQKWLKIVQIWSIVFENGPTWPKCSQISSNMFKYYQMWSNVVKCGQMWSIVIENGRKVVQYGQIRSNIIKSDKRSELIGHIGTLFVSEGHEPDIKKKGAGGGKSRSL